MRSRRTKEWPAGGERAAVSGARVDLRSTQRGGRRRAAWGACRGHHCLRIDAPVAQFAPPEIHQTRQQTRRLSLRLLPRARQPPPDRRRPPMTTLQLLRSRGLVTRESSKLVQKRQVVQEQNDGERSRTRGREEQTARVTPSPQRPLMSQLRHQSKAQARPPAQSGSAGWRRRWCRGTTSRSWCLEMERDNTQQATGSGRRSGRDGRQQRPRPGHSAGPNPASPAPPQSLSPQMLLTRQWEMPLRMSGLTSTIGKGVGWPGDTSAASSDLQRGGGRQERAWMGHGCC